MGAAKVMKVDMSDDKGIPLEVVLASQMLHPHIVQLFTFARSVPMNESTNSVKDVPQEDAAGTLTLVMEYCNAGSLMAAIHNGEYYNLSSSFERVPDLQAILATAIEIASGLAYMHSKGIVHGDLTAHNILLQSTFGKGRSSKKIAKIADFGLSRALTWASHETLTHGTVSHMAPELLEMGQMSFDGEVYVQCTRLETHSTRDGFETVFHEEAALPPTISTTCLKTEGRHRAQLRLHGVQHFSNAGFCCLFSQLVEFNATQ